MLSEKILLPISSSEGNSSLGEKTMGRGRAAKQNVLHKLGDDHLWGHLELQYDVTYPHIQKEMRYSYVDRALAIGEATARRYGSSSVDSLVQRLNVSVSYDERLGGTIRGGYTDSRIVINRKALQSIVGRLPELALSLRQLEQVSIAHELFHCLEEAENNPVHLQLPKVTTMRIGAIVLKQTAVRACREIAAHRFAKEMTGLAFMPNAIDWLVHVAKGTLTWSRLDALLRRAETFD